MPCALFPQVWPLKLFGYYVVHFCEDPERMLHAEAFVHHGLRTGVLTPVIARTFDPSDVADAHRRAEFNDQVSKIVLTPSSSCPTV